MEKYKHLKDYLDSYSDLAYDTTKLLLEIEVQGTDAENEYLVHRTKVHEFVDAIKMVLANGSDESLKQGLFIYIRSVSTLTSFIGVLAEFNKAYEVHILAGYQKEIAIEYSKFLNDMKFRNK